MNAERYSPARPSHVDLPLADAGLTSYRYAGRYGFVMIGATNDAGALREAARSIDGAPDPANLERWTGARYEKVTA